MDVAFALVIGAVVAVVLAMRSTERRDRALRLTAGEGRLRHLRSGDYPSSCSWCKTTTLGRKLLVFARTTEGWESTDVMTRLVRCPDAEVEGLASVLHLDHPSWRRFCGEPCVSQFFTAARAPLREQFVACAYCSARSPTTFVRCPNCGAAR